MKGDGAPIDGRHATYQSAQDGTIFRSYFAPAKAPSSPTVLILRGVAGPDSGYTAIADQLAAIGYAALVHAWQVRGDDPDDPTLVGDINSALEYLRGCPEVDAERIAAFGYCRGGGQALIAAAVCPWIRVVVCFHGFARRRDAGSPTRGHPLELVKQIRQPVLLLHGDDDQISPVEEMHELADALKKAGVSAEMHSYAGANHGFAVATHIGFRADAAQDSFNRAVSFLRERL